MSATAGNNIKRLGDKRRNEAFRYYLYAGSIVFGDILLLAIAGITPVLILLIALSFIPIVKLTRLGSQISKRAEHAYQGAEAEFVVGQLLEDKLRPLGWDFTYNFNFPRHGDIDVVALSPAARLYAIDVKSHKGMKQFINNELVRRYGKKVYSFKEGDLLAKVQMQADYLTSLMNNQAHPILCFTQSNVDIEGNIANGVYVVSATDLVDMLVNLG
jgi:hypothetical protein